MKQMLAIAILLFTSTIFGQESSDKDIIDRTVKFLKVNEKDLLRDLICIKTIPNQNEKVIILLPVITNRNPECEPCYDINNNILVWNKATKTFESKYFKKAEWTTDAIRFSDLKIDTGLYYLNKNTRAFGIVYTYSGIPVHPYNSDAINLYYFKDNQIIEVLHDFEIERLNGNNGTSCENSYYETLKNIFIINDKSIATLQFNDIIVKTKLKDYSLDSECDKEIIKKESTKTSVLLFDEKQKNTF